MDEQTWQNALAGCLVGGAIGDALGLPFEGLSPRRRAALFGDDISSGYRFIGRRGMVSDDTEHAAMTACALCLSGGEPELFTAYLARELRALDTFASRRGWACHPAGVCAALCGRFA